VKLSERLSALNRLQKTTMFKVVATVLVLVLAGAASATYVVGKAARDADMPRLELPPEEPAPADPAKLNDAEKQANELALQSRRAAEANVRAFNEILARRADPTSVFLAIAVGAGVAIGVVWLGLGLTGLSLLLILAAVCLPMYIAGAKVPPESAFGPIAGKAREASQFLAALGVLSFGFLALMELLRASLSGPYRITAIARNVVNEAVRMKVSVVFIVMLLFALAALPGLLDESTPLRYRVQSFLQYGTGGTFWIVAVLVLFLAVGTVAFEQRDKIIWQTMTKPVAGWQYLFGKWLGVVGVAAVLLAVSSAGVFLFVEYLRNQKAIGEDAAYVAREGPIAEDRFILENQVLSARAGRGPEMPELTREGMGEELKGRIERARQADPNWSQTQENVTALAIQIEKELRSSYLALEPGSQERFRFTGLSHAKEANTPVTFRFRLDFGSNDPRQTFKVSFLFPAMAPRVQEVPGGQTMTIIVSPAAINEKGELEMIAINGDILKRIDDPQDPTWTNDITMSFPPDGIEVFYAVGTYRGNFLRVMLCLWLKLAFLAMVAVWAATFLSFPVASLVAFGVFLMAESAGFLSNSLEYYASVDAQGNVEAYRVIVRAIATPVAGTFKFYSELRPTTNLVDGRMISWATVAQAVAVMGGLTLALYAVAVVVFRRRELATYSGQ